ncbi:hypothetical protein ES703_61376 [subsurface metagenome]
MDESIRYVIQRYTRALTHMREQMKLKRFGLVFGAGITEDFGFPSWNQLVDLISQDERVNGKQICGKVSGKTSVSQLLFQCYRTKVLQSLDTNFDKYDSLNSYIQSGWHKVVHDALYRNVPSELSELKARDKYLHEYLDIIKQTKLTINYNFDDTLQTLLSQHETKKRIEERGFRTIWSAD